MRKIFVIVISQYFFLFFLPELKAVKPNPVLVSCRLTVVFSFDWKGVLSKAGLDMSTGLFSAEVWWFLFLYTSVFMPVEQCVKSGCMSLGWREREKRKSIKIVWWQQGDDIQWEFSLGTCLSHSFCLALNTHTETHRSLCVPLTRLFACYKAETVWGAPSSDTNLNASCNVTRYAHTHMLCN